MLSYVLTLLVLVESSGMPNPPDGDGGRAVGPLQMHAAVVHDVNRIYGTNYTLADRRDPAMSRTMAAMYLAYYARQSGQPETMELYARIWNGGPDGWRKKATLKYWAKVRRAGGL